MQLNLTHIELSINRRPPLSNLLIPSHWFYSKTPRTIPSVCTYFCYSATFNFNLISKPIKSVSYRRALELIGIKVKYRTTTNCWSNECCEECKLTPAYTGRRPSRVRELSLLHEGDLCELVFHDRLHPVHHCNWNNLQFGLGTE